MFRARSLRVAAMAAAAGCLVLQGAIAYAHESTNAADAAQTVEVAAPQIEDQISAAEMQDLMFVAEQSGAPLDEVIERYAWNDNFALAAAEIRDTYPDLFSSAEIVDAHHAWVAFKGSPPEGVHAVLDSFARVAPSVKVELRGGEGYSERELQASIESVHYAVYESPGVRDAATSFDAATRTITTSVVLADGLQESVVTDLNTTAQEALVAASAKSLGIAAVVDVSDRAVLGGVDSSSYHYGGEVLSGCTSGFGTRASSSTSGTRGIATAGHCGNSQSDDGSALTYQGGHVETHGDFQWHTGPRTESDDFYAGTASTTETTLRDVSAVGSPTVGQTLCKNGATNHASCQQVRALNHCNGSACNLVMMGARLAAGGDSGGPIYWGNTAYGLHQGWKYDPAWPADRDLFSRADRIDNALGVWIATN
ncbi:S1 family peptidase [Bowdeniella massiliensis]|uniref:S1 family peptidase n=1 Tax=Bowdeniella massiliensis TaxID=2932264 RepID=UPI002027E0B9|nr:S1 family peptidase [Bowdeniella massiliensis]